MKANKPRTPRVQHLGLETVSSIHRRHNIARQTVLRAIESGRLPAYVAKTDDVGRPIYLVKPSDADSLWGILPIDHELVSA
ncbi:hypothetical protein MFAL_39860 [Mycolicibacterium fallax]|nr:hypothetical protein MFAL_39860 [Mycolicibacterium fallax]